MINHVVTFRFKGSDSERKEVAHLFREALLSLPDKIEVLRDIKVGINMNPIEDWDLTLIATVDKLDDVATYSAHPAHQAAVKIIAPYKLDRACVDFEMEE